MTPDHADTAPAYPSHSGQFADMLNARCNLHSAHNSLVLWSAHKLAGRDMDAEEEARAARDAVRRAAKCLGIDLAGDDE